MRWTIAKKLGLGFGMLIALTVGVAGVVVVKLGKVNTTQTRLLTLRQPMVATGSALLNGINQSLAALRGYILLGNEEFKQRRAATWTELHDRIDTLTAMYARCDTPKSIAQFNELKTVLTEFEQAQKQVEDICRAPENQPALHMLLTEAAPHAATMLAAVTAMIDDEKALEATPARKKLLADLADTRGSLAVGVASIRAYLLAGDERFADAFHKKWEVNTARLESLKASATLFTPRQAEAFAEYTSARAAFEPLPTRMFEIRGSDKWNVANHLLGTEAAPRGARCRAILSALIAEQNDRMQADAAALASESRGLTRDVLAAAVIAVIIGSIIAWVNTRRVTGPARQMLELANAVADGDVSRQVTITGTDELAELGKAFNRFTSNLRSIVQNITGTAQELAGSSDGLKSTATDLATGAEKATQQSGTVAAAAEQMAQNMTNMAGSTEEMSANTQTVASAVEEMSVSIGEVARNAEKAAGVAGNAAQLADASNAKISELGTAADEIGKVIEVIQDISEQTNLLALNATIEAARAGEAGKGFAVVATEVKELARQTATATDDIRKRIEGIQNATGQSVQAIGEISEVIRNVNEVSRTIASAVEEQSITTREIAQNVAETTAAAETVSRGVAESASACQEITENIARVDQSNRTCLTRSGRVQGAGGELAGLAQDLRTLLAQFHTGAAEVDPDAAGAVTQDA